MDSEERQILKGLYKDFEEEWSRHQREADQGLQDDLSKAHQNAVKPLTQENIQEITNSYWAQKQPELDYTRETLGNRMFENHGGSEHEALKSLQNDGQEQIQQTKELQEDQQLDMQRQQVRQDEIAQGQQPDKDEKEKKEKDKQNAQDQDKQRQLNAENTKEQRDELERQRLRQQFNEMGGQERSR